MAHQIEQMAYVGETPWHGLGNPLTQNQPIEVWAQQAGMDWRIESSDVSYIWHKTNVGKASSCPMKNSEYCIALIRMPHYL